MDGIIFDFAMEGLNGGGLGEEIFGGGDRGGKVGMIGIDVKEVLAVDDCDI